MMSIVGKIKTLFSDKEKTEALFPRTKVKAVSDDDGIGLNVLLDKKAGKIVAGETFTIDGTSITAGEGAEIFNDYNGNKATGMCSHAEGVITEASGDYAHAEGNGSKASDIGSHAEGVQTTASGAFSHSEGLNTIASGQGAHAEGNETTASGGYSHVEGCFSTASGIYSHAEGYSATASGESSHAEGYSTVASRPASHAEGTNTIAASASQHVQGKYNIEDAEDTYAHIVGNGTTSTRSNAHTLDWDGNAWFAGAIDVEDKATTLANIGAAPQATVTSALGAKGWYRVGKVASRYNDNAGGAAFRITVGSVYNNFINSTSIVEGVSSYDNGQLSTLFSWGGGYPITSVRLCQVSESQKASVYIDVYYNQSNTNNCFVTVDTTTGTFTPNSALTAVTTSETVVCETTLSGRYPFTTAHTIPITNGGTGATTAANALTNLGAAPASHTHSEYATKDSPVFKNSISMARKSDTTVGTLSTALGHDVTASARYSHAEGKDTTASGEASHAEGSNTTASGRYSHAECCSKTASGEASHAEGDNTTASGKYSHAEGKRTTASGEASHAGGTSTVASNYASFSIGKHSKAMTDGGSQFNQTGDVMVIGNGTSGTVLSNAFRVTYGGATYGLSAFNASGADYAEFFEWLDGNPEVEDRIGLFVTLDGGKIVKANAGDYILGIVSGNPCIVGNSDEDWLNRWEKDEFGRFIKEEVRTPVTERKEVEVDVLDDDGNPTGEKAIEMEEIETGEYTVGWKYKQNPDYDTSQAYVERKYRQEWDYIGMMGVLPVIDDGTCQVNGYCKVADGGTATASDTGYRVICRVSDNVVKVVFR